MRSSVLACLVVLSLGLSAAPAALAADASMGSMSGMLTAFSRGLLSADAAKKPVTKKKPHPKPHKKASKPKPHKKKPTKKRPTKKRPTKKRPTKKRPTPKKTTPKPKPTPKKPTPKAPTRKPVSVPASPSGKNTIPKGAPGVVQPNIADPTPVAPKAGSGTCVSGPFTIFNSPLVAFASANTTCTSHNMQLATITAIFEPNNNHLMQAAQTAIQACAGSNAQVWFDTTLTATDVVPQCNAFMVTNQPTAGTISASGRRLAGATPLILLASSVPTGCGAKLPVMCM